MDTPGTVTKRAEGNTFVRSTGLYFAGQTGFGMHTGFYLTNSGNYPIETSIASVSPDFPEVFDFPSGRSTPITILPGEHKFVPLNVRFIQDNLTATGPSQSGPVGNLGPDRDGLYDTTVKLSTISQYDGSSDPSGPIYIYLTGQVTGVNVFTSEFPPKVSGFLVKTDFNILGKPEAKLRWFHPETGYYVTRYRMEYAEGIDDSSVPTGSWTGVQSLTPPERQSAPYYNINNSTVTIYNSNYDNNPVTCRTFADASGINQLYTTETTGNRGSNYAEFTVQGLGFGADYYYRVRPEYIHPANDAAYYGEWVYGYPVSDFNEAISNNEVLTGLASGCPNTLPPEGSASNIKNSTSNAQSLDIYFKDGSSDINLYTAAHDELKSRGLTNADGSSNLNVFDDSHADFAFTGVKYIVPENATVGSKSTTKAGIETGDKLVDASNAEVNTFLILNDNSTVAGHGGTGGDGGFTTMELNPDGGTRKLIGSRNRININQNAAKTTASTVGRDGTAAIKITDSSIQLFRIGKSFSAKIYGGGGGGGGGDPFFWPKSFTLNRVDNSDVLDFTQYNPTWANGGTLITKEAPPLDAEGNEVVFDVTVDRDLNRNTQYEQRLSYRLSDILGVQVAGVGGGGQGFGLSQGGSSLYTEKDSVAVKSQLQQGSIEKIGDGGPIGARQSPGGAGGAFGEDGEEPLNVNAGTFYNRNVVDAVPQAGGKAGAAIESLSSTYTTSNFLGKLIVGPDQTEKAPTEIPGLLGWWDSTSANASNIIKSKIGDPEVAVVPGSDGLANGTYNQVRISKWYAKDQDGNKASSIYMEKYSRYWSQNRTDLQPSWRNKDFITGGIANEGNLPITQYVGKQSVMFWDGKTIRAMEINGLVGSGKLEEDMDGFEIMYHISPVVNYNTSQTQFYPETPQRVSGKSKYWHLASKFAKDHGPWRTPSSPRGWSLHQWSDIGPGTLSNGVVVSAADSYQNSTFFYDKDGFIVENAGVANQRFKFRDFTNAINPKRSWVYSISARKKNNRIEYSVYNDTRRMFFTTIDASTFSWMPKPIIGACSRYNVNNNYLGAWFGAIVHLCVFKRSLTYQERNSLVNYFLIDGSNILSSTDKSNEDKRNTLDMENGYAGFNIFPS